MRKFDVDGLGMASLGAILGAAQVRVCVHIFIYIFVCLPLILTLPSNQYSLSTTHYPLQLAFSRTVSRRQVEAVTKANVEERKELLQRRAEYKQKLGTKTLDGTVLEEGSMKRDAMKNIIEKLAQSAYIAIRGKALKPLNTARARITSREFRSILVELNCGLIPREVSMLERRYYIASCGSIDSSAFKAEFIALGKDVIRERMRNEALQSFLKTLAKTNPEKQVRLSSDEVSAETGTGTGTDTGTGGDSSVGDGNYGTYTGSDGMTTSDPAGATSTSTDGSKLATDEALNAAVAANDTTSIDRSKFSIDQADEWIGTYIYIYMYVCVHACALPIPFTITLTFSLPTSLTYPLQPTHCSRGHLQKKLYQ